MRDGLAPFLDFDQSAVSRARVLSAPRFFRKLAVNPITDFYRSDVRTGIKIVLTSLILGTLTAVPLWLFTQFGAADVTPTGLALTAMFGTIAGAFGAAIGVVWWIIEVIVRRR